MRLLALHLLFFLTGASGLVYEVIWTRMLGHVVGNTTQAIGLVLAAFMAGLALGSYLLGAWADRRRDPLKVYAFLELGVAASALAIPGTFQLLVHGYVVLHRSFGEHAALVGGVRFVVAFAVLVVPTFLMGATLPVLARFAARHGTRVGTRLGTLYGANTLGAMLGAWASGFWLMRLFGITGANHLAVAVNVVVAACALLLHLRIGWVRQETSVPKDASVPTPGETPPAGRAEGARSYVLLYGLSGLVALALEVLWTKSLAFFLGNTTQAFATMLTTFLFGLSLGAFAAARLVERLADPKRAVGTCLVGLGAAGLATLPAFGAILNRIGMQHAAGNFLVAMLVMLPATLFMGAMLPLTARVYAAGAADVGRRVGRMYAVNTVGAILGSLLAAFATIPLWGIQGSVLAACGTALAAGAGVLLRRGGRAAPVATAFQVTAAVVLLAVFVATGRERFFSVLDYTFRGSFQDEIESLYYNETSSGIVEVTREGTGDISYKLDGQNQAKTSAMGLRVHNLLSQLGLLLHPAPKDVLMIALGGGITAGGAVPFDALDPIDHLDVVEINPAIVDVARLFSDFNHDVLAFPRTHVVIEDGRNFLLTTDRRYDVIVTGIIHPKYNAGNAGMYGREYYELVRRRLKPGGVVVQWVPIYGLRPSEFKGILTTFADAFPHTTLWFAQTFGGFGKGSYNLIAVGSAAPLPLDYAALEHKMAHPEVRRAMRAYGVTDPVELLDTFITDAPGLAAYTDDTAVIHDDHNPLEFLPREEHTKQLLTSLIRARRPVADLVQNLDDGARQRLVRRQAISDRLLPVELAASRGAFGPALRDYDRVIALNPGAADVVQAREEVRYLARRHAEVLGHRSATRTSPDGCLTYAAALIDALMWRSGEAAARRCLELTGPDGEPAARAHLLIGRARAKRDDPAGAEAAWRLAVAAAPERLEAYAELGRLARRAGRTEEALAWMRQAAARAPDQAGPQVALMRAQLAAGRASEAVATARHILTLDPDNGPARRLLAAAARAAEASGGPTR